MKRIMLLVCALMLCMVCSAYAGEYEFGPEHTGPIVIDGAGEHTVILNGVTIDGWYEEVYDDGMGGEMTELVYCSALTIKSPATKVTVILGDGTENKFTAGQDYSGIAVIGKVELIICCEKASKGHEHECDDTCGKLIAFCNDSGGAGIGSDPEEEFSGSITINGGNIDAAGGYDGAGIGSGSNGGFSGAVTINSGNVIAAGNDWAAGIGSSSSGEFSGTVTINGGNVTATSYCGAGIGGGEKGEVSGTIAINGGNVTATNEYSYGAGIGSGYRGEFSGTVIIAGGKVTATSGWNGSDLYECGAGIGAGYNGDMSGKVIVKGGSVTATGAADAAGIGSGNNGSMSGTVTVYDGTLYAAGGYNAAGIGSGRRGAMSGKLIVHGGDVTVVAGGVSFEDAPIKYVPAVGAGYEGTVTVDMIVDADPLSDKIGAKSGYDEADAKNLEGSPWSSKTNIIPLFGSDRYLRFRYLTSPATPVPVTPTPAPVVPDVPQTGDSMNFVLIAVLAAAGMLGMTVILRKKNEA